MSKENSRERIIQLAFGAYPEAKQFHFTSDDQAFSEANDANNHADTLKDKEVELIKRSDLKKKSKETDGSATKGDQHATGNGATSSAAVDVEREALVVRYKELLGKNPNHNTGIPKLKEAIEKAEAAKATQEDGDGTKHTITQEDLDANPDLVEQGVKVGDEVELSGE